MIMMIASSGNWSMFLRRRYIVPISFYLTGDMTNHYPFIQGLLEWPFRELFSANVSLWSQYSYIAFNFCSCRILIISYKTLIITGISM